MKILTTIALLSFSLTCSAQSKLGDYILSADFSPSFGVKESKLIIKRKLDYGVIELKVYKSGNFLFLDDTAKINTADLKKVTDFLHLNQLKLYPTQKIRKKNKNLPVLTGFDGIYIDLDFDNRGKKATRHLWSPSKESDEGRLMTILFSMMQNYFKDDDNAVDYLKQLKEFLD